MRYGLLIFFLAISACSLEGKKNKSLLNLMFQGRTENPLSTFDRVSVRSAPSDITGFSCLGVNVVGPGIADTGGQPESFPNFGPLLARENSCAYRGAVAGPFYLNGSNPINVSIEVPTGAPRIIQMVGVTTASECIPGNFVNGSASSPGVYEIGRAVTDLFSDKSVTIVNDYPSGGDENRRVDCGDNCTTAYDSVGVGGMVAGSLATRTVAQKVVISSPVYLQQIQAYLGRASGAGAVTIDFCDDSAGSPGTCPGGNRQSSAAIPASTDQWLTFDFATPGTWALISPGTYWIKLSMTANNFKWFANDGSGQPGKYTDNEPAWFDVGNLGTIAMFGPLSDSNCILNSSGSVHCVGSGTNGELGDTGVTTKYNFVPTPISFVGFTSPTKIVGGFGHACGMSATGLVNCWGDNPNGQVGDATAVDKLAPTTVTVGATVVDITAGNNHTCIVGSTGAVKCWGQNTAGQFGDGTTGSSTSPTASTGNFSAAIVKISAGASHTCAISSGGNAYCSGQGTLGQLGQGSAVNSTTAVAAGVGGIAVGVAVGASHSCVLLSSGAVQCWGANVNGEVGDGTLTQRNSPVGVSGITAATMVMAGKNHTCAIEGNLLKCWGDNVFGQLGDGTTTDRTSPVVITLPNSDIPAAVYSNASADYTCAVSTAGRGYCWGSIAPSYGKLGSGYKSASVVLPTEIMSSDNFAYRMTACP
jgi:alpha-tubulin suppressor-like RCC1 family protein